MHAEDILRYGLGREHSAHIGLFRDRLASNMTGEDA